MFDDNAASLIQELILHGFLEMSSLILKRLIDFYTHLDKTEIDQNKLEANFQKIKESFEKLVNSEFILRLPQLDSFNQQNDVIKNGSSKSHETENKNNTNGISQNQRLKVPIFLPNDYSKREMPHIIIDSEFLVM